MCIVGVCVFWFFMVVCCRLFVVCGVFVDYGACFYLYY